MIQPPENVAAHFFWIAMPVILATGLGQLLSYWASRKSSQETFNKAMSGLITERKYFPSHGHNEKSGPLQAEGISYPPEDK